MILASDVAILRNGGGDVCVDYGRSLCFRGGAIRMRVAESKVVSSERAGALSAD